MGDGGGVGGAGLEDWGKGRGGGLGSHGVAQGEAG